MSRNRKNQSAAARLGPMLKALALCVLVGGAGLGYVYFQEQILVLSKQIAERERRAEELRTQNQRLARQLEDLRSPRSLDMRVRELAPGLGVPQPDQVVRLVETRPRNDVLMAGRSSRVGAAEAMR